MTTSPLHRAAGMLLTEYLTCLIAKSVLLMMTNSVHLLRLPRTHVPRYSQLPLLLVPAGSATETLWHVYNRLYALPSMIAIYCLRHATKPRRHGSLSRCSTLTSGCLSLPQDAAGHWRCRQGHSQVKLLLDNAVNDGAGYYLRRLLLSSQNCQKVFTCISLSTHRWLLLKRHEA